MLARLVLTIALVLATSAALSAQTTFTVTSTANDGPGSLRQAILDANAGAGADVIAFAIPGTGPHTIVTTTPLPEVTDPVVIDGYTQPGSQPNTLGLGGGTNAVLQVEIDGNDTGDLFTAVFHLSGGGSTVRGLVIRNGADYDIWITGPGGNTVAGCFLGTDAAGASVPPTTSFYGVYVAGSSDNVIGGTTPADRNLIAGYSQGIRLGADFIDETVVPTTSTRIEGNLIGTDATGTVALPNDNGIQLVIANANVLGGEAPGARNVIAGNRFAGISLIAGSSENVIAGNYVGTDVTGQTALGNGWYGVFLSDQARDNVIGGATAAARNVIAGNSGQGRFFPGLVIDLGSNGNRVQSNYVGLAADGATVLPNAGGGVYVTDSERTIIGGETAVPGEPPGNVIAGNQGDGIRLLTATEPRDSAQGGGEPVPAHFSVVQGNLIGLRADGTTAAGNAGEGIALYDASFNELLDNVVAASGRFGVLISGAQYGIADDNILARNFIGTTPEGAARGNGSHGIQAQDSGPQVIGGTYDAGGACCEGNTIAYNGGAGVTVMVTGAVSFEKGIRGNRMYENAGLGIDLGGDGPTPNDPGDADGENAPNRLQNYPVVRDAVLDDAGTLTLSYLVDTATENATYPLTVEYFLADTDGEEGAVPLGTATILADAAQTPQRAELPAVGTIPAGALVVATAIDALGNTSEFSAPVAVTGSVDAEPDADLPAVLALRTYPNPTAGRVAIEIALPETADVHAAVFDVLGRRVAVLADGPLAAGTHPLTLDTARLPAGLYVVRAEADGVAATRRVTVLR